jgi:hypothetical protein
VLQFTHWVSPILAGLLVRSPRNQGVTTVRMGKSTTAKSEIRVEEHRFRRSRWPPPLSRSGADAGPGQWSGPEHQSASFGNSTW